MSMDFPYIGSLTVYLTAGLILVYYANQVSRAWRKNPTTLPYPPGPRPLPIIGNIRQIPTTFPWLTYREWGRQYGPMIHFRAYNDHLIIVNSAKIADDLFEKRSRIYSDRPDYPMLNLMGWEFNFAFMRYGDNWRQHRRLMHQFLRLAAVPAYHPVQVKKSHDLLRIFLSHPKDFYVHLQTYAAAIIMATVYGYDIAPVGDPFVSLAQDAMHRMGQGTIPAAIPVNMFPWLRHFPGWLPGFGFQQFCADTRLITAKMRDEPYEFAKKQLIEEHDSTSMVAKMIESGKTEVQLQKDVAGLAYGAGADTTFATMASFVLLMATHPEVQKKAQAEIDAVLGSHRLPEFSDKAQLPYVEALCREVLRWMPLVPLSPSRKTTEDDIYEGYFIPKGTSIVPNLWAMCQDEAIYPEPEKFKPERFLTEDGRVTTDPLLNPLAFGHGRRSCVGRHLAEDSVWIAMASLLTVYNFGKAKDASGNEIEIPFQFSDGLIIHSEPFECSITPRSEIAIALIEGTAEKNG
ncbi:Cytochrome P450 [Mycena indigotica]|uniref:Cytochrome P450 n=1 Tax=Mycena indigotica TaxID=2126181 RepID=A0A8H6SJ43_9AGAR|nr:Cytochrome P450 [Mycena indigotica]KAF7299262.1 Cytochrome P450 [Mycena indigotica]